MTETVTLPSITALYRLSGFANIPDDLVAVDAAVANYDTQAADYRVVDLAPPASIATAVQKGAQIARRGDGALGLWFGDAEWRSEAPDPLSDARPFNREEAQYLDAYAFKRGF